MSILGRKINFKIFILNIDIPKAYHLKLKYIIPADLESAGCRARTIK